MSATYQDPFRMIVGPIEDEHTLWMRSRSLSTTQPQQGCLHPGCLLVTTIPDMSKASGLSIIMLDPCIGERTSAR